MPHPSPNTAPVRQVNALRFIRQMRGGAHAHLLQCDNGSSYVTKLFSNPQGGRRILINELICSVLMKKIGIHTPDLALVNLDAGFAAAVTPMVRCNGTELSPGLEIGVHFGSRFPGDPARVSVFDFLPESMLTAVVNRDEFFGALAFDQWVSNADARQAIFYRAMINSDVSTCPRVGWVAQFIDNGLAFQGSNWGLPDSPIQGVYWQRAAYGPRPALPDLYGWINAIIGIDRDALFGILSLLPQNWIQGQERELERLLNGLLLRRERLPLLMAKAVSQLQSRPKRCLPSNSRVWKGLPKAHYDRPSSAVIIRTRVSALTQ